MSLTREQLVPIAKELAQRMEQRQWETIREQAGCDHLIAIEHHIDNQGPEFRHGDHRITFDWGKADDYVRQGDIIMWLRRCHAYDEDGDER